LSVQKKLDCSVSETRLSDFHGFNYPGITYPFTLFSLSSSQEQS
jgi:hypothetical protein